MSGFSGAINEAHEQESAKQERGLQEHLRKHGVPEPHDLGRRLGLRERFRQVNGATFEQIMEMARNKG